MSIELKKEVVQLNETACRMSCEAFVEADIIVPDVKPDIARILQIDANPVIMEKSVFSDKVVFEGQMELCILYISDEGCVKSIHNCHKFSHTVTPKNISEDMFLEAYCALIKLDYRLLNSRKINISATIGIDFVVTKDVHTDLCVGVLDSDTCHCRHTAAKPYVALRSASEEITIREALELPAGNPDVDEVLKIDTHISNKDVRITGNKAVIKGDAMCTMLYSSGYDSATVNQSEHEISFTEIIDVSALLEEYDSDVDFIVKMTTFSIKQDNDGDNRIVVVDIVMDAVVRMAHTVNVNLLDDIYSTAHNLEVTKKQVQLDELVADLRTQSTFKSTAALPDAMPEIVQVYNVTAIPHLKEAVLSKGSVQLAGEIEITVLYQSSEMSMPVNSFTHIMPYTQTLEADEADAKMICDANINVDHIGYNMNMPNELDLRCILGISIKILNPKHTDTIEIIEESDLPESADSNKCCIKIYFAQERDTLWNIGKRYHISVERLAAANNLDESAELKIGQQIIIPL